MAGDAYDNAQAETDASDNAQAETTETTVGLYKSGRPVTDHRFRGRRRGRRLDMGTPARGLPREPRAPHVKPGSPPCGGDPCPP
jgi:hypothetical protein